LNFPDLLSGGKQQSWKGLPAETIMGHIHLHVSELKKTEEFYIKGLGFEVVNRFGAQALFISDGKYHHLIALNPWNGVGAPTPAANIVGLDAFDLIRPSEEKKNDIIKKLNNFSASGTEEYGSTIATDPCGGRIHLGI